MKISKKKGGAKNEGEGIYPEAISSRESNTRESSKKTFRPNSFSRVLGREIRSGLQSVRFSAARRGSPRKGITYDVSSSAQHRDKLRLRIT